MKGIRFSARGGFGMAGFLAMVALISVLAAACLSISAVSLQKTRIYQYADQAYFSAKSALDALVTELCSDESELRASLDGLKAAAEFSIDPGDAYGTLTGEVEPTEDGGMLLTVRAEYRGVGSRVSALLTHKSVLADDVFKGESGEVQKDFTIPDISWDDRRADKEISKLFSKTESIEIRSDGIFRRYNNGTEELLYQYSGRDTYLKFNGQYSIQDNVLRFSAIDYPAGGNLYIMLENIGELDFAVTHNNTANVFFIDVGAQNRGGAVKSVVFDKKDNPDMALSAYFYTPSAVFSRKNATNLTPYRIYGYAYLESIEQKNGNRTIEITNIPPSYSSGQSKPPVSGTSGGGWEVVRYE